MNANDFQLPAGLPEILLKLPAVENRYLYFNRYAPFNAVGKETIRRKVFDSVSASCREEDNLLIALNTRFAAGDKALLENNEHIISFTLMTAAPLIHGLGGKGVYEVGFTFHPIYGTPYLPGSSLKGIACAFARAYHGGLIDADDNEIFGTQDCGGVVDFHDAFPENGVQLETDVMTPHYPDYYQQDKLPTDDQHPKPVLFLSIPFNVSFNFRVSGQKRHTAQVEQAAEYLHGGLRELGAGGKTAAGYGYFKEV